MEVHGCCGCSCHVCEGGHETGRKIGNHTEACEDRFWKEQEDGRQNS